MEFFKCANCGNTMGVNVISIHGTISKDQLNTIQSFEDFNKLFQSLDNLQCQLEPMHLDKNVECQEPQLTDEDITYCNDILDRMSVLDKEEENSNSELSGTD